MSDPSRPVILIDFSALFRRAWHVQSDVSHAYEATIGGVNRASGMFPDSLIAICCDGKGNWRKELAPTYKAQREAQPQSMYGEMDRTLDRLKKDGRLIWKFDGFEADDVIASACMRARTRGHEVHIVSHDKDLLQLLGPGVDFVAIHVSPWATKTHMDVIEKYGVETTQLGDWLALKGDSSDNIKGCPGVGDKTATQLLQKYNSIQGIYHALDPANGFDPPATPNICKNLELHKADVEIARKLVSLSTDVPLHFDDIYEIREIEENKGDPMSEAEKDAERFFGKEISSGAEQSPSTTETETKTQPEENKDRASLSETLASPQVASPVLPGTGMIEGFKAEADKIALKVLEENEVTAIVEYSRQLEPRSLREASIYAELMFYSKVYSRYPTKQSIVAAIVRGREMGYGAGASLDIFHVADFNRDGNLRLMLHAHVIIERAMRDPGLEYFALVKTTATECEYEAKVKRNPKPTSLTYTIEDAKNAGLVRLTQNGQPNTWMKRPTELLRKTCGVQLARIVAPWSSMGLYCPEEMGVDYE